MGPGIEHYPDLRHPEPSQLWFQIAEIRGDRTYLQHGVTVREGDVVLDVGANVGVAATFFATDCGAGVVHSFEPVAPIFEILRGNLRRLTACKVHNYGLSSTRARAKITYYPRADAMSSLYAEPDQDRALVRQAMLNRGTSEAEADRALSGRYEPETLECELRPLSEALDELSLDRVDLLKIDVEKAELDVLEGIADGDWPRLRQIAAEVHDIDGRCAAITRMLSSRGFAVSSAQEPSMRDTGVFMLYAIHRSADRRG